MSSYEPETGQLTAIIGIDTTTLLIIDFYCGIMDVENLMTSLDRGEVVFVTKGDFVLLGAYPTG